MESPQNRNRMLVLIIGLLAMALVTLLVKQFLGKEPTFDEDLERIALDLSSRCPLMVDQDTRMDNVMALPGKVLRYNYTLVNLLKDSLDVVAFEETMQPLILNTVKTHPDLKYFRDNGVTLSYFYRDREGNFVNNITVNPGNYMHE